MHISLFESQMAHRERDLPCIYLVPKWPQRAGLGWSHGPGPPSSSPTWGAISDPKRVTRRLELKQSVWDSSQHSHMGCRCCKLNIAVPVIFILLLPVQVREYVWPCDVSGVWGWCWGMVSCVNCDLTLEFWECFLRKSALWWATGTFDPVNVEL